MSPLAQVVKFSEMSLLALHGLVVAAQTSPKPVNSLTIAETLQGSENTIAKVMQRLVKDGFVRSSRGPAGGFVLAQSLQHITVSIHGQVTEKNWF